MEEWQMRVEVLNVCIDVTLQISSWREIRSLWSRRQGRADGRLGELSVTESRLLRKADEQGLASGVCDGICGDGGYRALSRAVWYG